MGRKYLISILKKTNEYEIGLIDINLKNIYVKLNHESKSTIQTKSRI